MSPTPQPIPPATLAAVPSSSRAGEALDAWRRRLLDLSKRNRALNFRPARVATVTVRDELPTEVFRLLYLEEVRMSFAALRPSATAVASPAETPSTSDIGAELDAPYQRPEHDALRDRHSDRILQCDHTPESLDKSLLRLAELARSSEEEQGVSTLFLSLGMLTFPEAPGESAMLRAPLVLLPVSLARTSARAGFTVECGDDEPLANPTLIEYLRLIHRAVLPPLPDLSIEPGFDLRSYFDTVSALASANGWTLTNDIYLAGFAFAKLVMFKDLERNAELFAEHRLVRQLVTRDDAGEMGLPAEIEALELDRDFPVETTAQVVDADSSQLRAIAAVARGHDCVVEGPPGTGKSQTITNLIANALSRGQNVLFVAEKMAALDVVHRRLTEAGLGEFCFVLHATKGNKAAVISDLRRTWEAAVARPSGAPRPAERLMRTREELTAYAREIHTPVAPLELTPYEGFGRFADVASATKVRYEGAVEQVTSENLESWLRRVDAVVHTAAAVGDVASSAWRDAAREHYGEAERDAIVRSSERVLELARSFLSAASETTASLGGPEAFRVADVTAVREFRDLVAQSPGCESAHLDGTAWERAPDDAILLLELGERMASLEHRLQTRLSAAALREEATADVAFMRARLRGVRAWVAIFDGRFRTVRAHWRSLAAPGRNASGRELLADFERVLDWQRVRRELMEASTRGQALFGRHWRGVETNWKSLRAFVEWVAAYRAFTGRHALGETARLAVLAGPAPTVAPDRVISAAAELATALAAWTSDVGWPARLFDGHPVAEIAARAEALLEQLAVAPRWGALQRARRELEGTPAAPMADAAITGTVPISDLHRIFERAFFERWCDCLVRERPILAKFDTRSHDQRVVEFRQLDRQMLSSNRSALASNLRDMTTARISDDSLASARSYLQRELARQRRFSPLRKTLVQAGGAVRALKPCFLMSPMAVAQFWPAELPPFDLVVFDEASQLPTEDAVGAICRGRQLVVVGDPKQLPPTNFFSSSLADDDVQLGEDGTPIIEDAESVLEEFLGSGTAKARLKWHYRSAHESLIHFSNTSFYDSDLLTFPSVETPGADRGLSFTFVKEGLYEGGGVNRAEARVVVDAIVEHFRVSPDRSLGVGTFSHKQQSAILDELELRRRHDISLEAHLDARRPEPFFVKNLENIQGDERDVILLSVTYGRAADGRVRYNFGPINGENGWRRLNVLTTRAREQMRVFSSMRSTDISPVAAASRGPTLLREFLHFAEHGRIEGHTVSALAATESPFERAVLRELGDRGYLVDPQVGVSGYRIDLGIRVADAPGRYICGVECDGATYHSSATARDRDRLRQQVLEDRGWAIVRVWSTDWFKDREGQVERLLTFIENSRHNVVEAPPTRVADVRVQMQAPEPLKIDISVKAYRHAEVRGRFEGRALLDERPGLVADLAFEVVTAEGPIHHALLCDRIAQAWGQRLGSRIKAHVESSIRSMERSKSVKRSGEFYHIEGQLGVVRGGRQGDHGPELVHPQELALAICRVLAEGSVREEGLAVALRELLGVSTGAASRRAVSQRIAALKAAGHLADGPGGLTVRSVPH